MQNIIDKRVLIFPSSAALGRSNVKISFVFSLTQVEDILKEMTIVEVPFSPHYVKGVARWRDQVIPVLSLEGTLGLAYTESKETRRFIMVRSSYAFNGLRRRMLLSVRPAIRILSLPITCAPLSSVGWIPNSYLIRGVYRWEEGYLVVVNLENILSGQ